MTQKRDRPVDSYTDAEWERLREDFRLFARKLTRENGRFSYRELKRRGWGHTVVRVLFEEFEEEGKIYDIGRFGGIWIEEPDTFYPRRWVSLGALSRTYRERVLEEVREWAHRSTEESGFCSPARAERDLDLSQSLAEEVLEELADQGSLIASERGFVDPDADWNPTEKGVRKLGAGLNPNDRAGRERLEEIYESVFLPAVRERTREAGQVTLHGLVEHHGLSEKATRRFIDRARRDERLVRLTPEEDDREKVFYQSTDVEPANLGDMELRGLHSLEQTTARRVTRRVRDILDEKGPRTVRELREAIGVSEGLIRKCLQGLIERGEVADLGNKRGFGLQTELDQQATLQDLLEAVEQGPAAADTTRGAPGREQTGPEGRLVALSESQKEWITGTLADKIGEHVGPPDTILLSSPLCSWDPQAGGWTLTVRLAEAGVYDRVLSACRNLRRFAYAHDWVDWDEERVWVANRERYPAAWKPEVDRLTERAIAANDGRAQEMLRAGVRRLAVYASARGEEPDSVNWEAIREQLIRDREEGRLSQSRFRFARRAYKVLQQAGEIDAPRWKPPRERLSLLPEAAVMPAIEGTWAGWTEGEFDLSRLVKGPYGVAAWHRWATAKAWELQASEQLPERSWPEVIDGNRDPDRFLHATESTLRGRYVNLNRLLGFVRRETDRDVQTVSLLDLADPVLIDRLADEMRLSSGISLDQKNPPYSHGTQTLLTHLLSYLLFTLLQASRRGDDARWEEAREAREHLRAYLSDVEDNLVRRKDIRKIAAAWRGNDHRAGWKKLYDLVGLLIAEAEAKAGGVPLEQQAEELLEFNRGERDEVSFSRSHQWARAFRRAMVFHIARRLPLRPSELRALTLEMWKRWGEGTGEWPTGPWSGVLGVEVPGEVMKRDTAGDDSYRVAFIPEDKIGDPEAEEGTRRELLYVWFADGGARERLLTDADGVCHESPYVLPSEASNSKLATNPDLHWAKQNLETTYSDAILQHAESLEMNPDRLDHLYGATSPHVHRTLFGTYWADEKRAIIYASERLHHSDPETTYDMYVAHDPARTMHEDLGGEEKETTDLERLRDENRELRQRREELQEELMELRKTNLELQTSLQRLEARLDETEGRKENGTPVTEEYVEAMVERKLSEREE